MKRYVKNKDFIPSEFIEKLNKNSNNNNDRLIRILIFINIFIIPITANRLAKIISDNKTVPVVNIVESNQDINKNKLKAAIKAINDNMISMKIQDNAGSIEFHSIEEIYNIEDKKTFKINSLNINDKNKYFIEVGL